MTTIQQYIESGIIESYALGLSSPDEAMQFEHLLPFHPELKDALNVFELGLESFALQQRVPPPPDIRGKVLDRIRELPDIRRVYRQNGRDGKKEKETDAGYIPAKISSTQISVHKFWRVAFIVVFIISKIFLALYIHYYIRYHVAEREIYLLQQQVIRAGSTSLPAPAGSPK